MHPARRRLASLSAAIAAVAAVVALVLPAGPASAAAVSAAGTRVGASHPVMILTVGLSHQVLAVQGRCEPVPQAQFVSGACVAAEEIPDAALVVRGGTNTAERFANASGVRADEFGKVYDVSVNSAPGRSIEELSQGIPNKQIGVTTVGEIRQAGGYIEPKPLENNPFHCYIGGCTPEQFSQLFTPTIKNPWTG
jgi:hypothetical protein